MPGIATVVHQCNDGSALTKRVEAMCSAMCYHEWEQFIVHHGQDTAIGSVNLASANAKHHVCERTGVTVFVDGEIYCTRDDNGAREPVLGPNLNPAKLSFDLYQKTGPDFVRQIEGAFAIVVVDPVARRVVVASDRFGLRPIYYARLPGELLICSQVTPILAQLPNRPTLDTTALFEHLSVGYVRGNGTHVSEVLIVPPASTVTYDLASHDLQITKYWSLDFKEPEGRSSSYYAKGLADRLMRAVRCRLGPDERVLITLSGGIDSRVLLACALGIADLRTFTFGFPGNPDIPLAEQVAREARLLDRHELMHLDGDFVIDNLPRVVAQTDGLITSFQTVGNAALDTVRANSDVSLDGMQVIGSRIAVTIRSFSRYELFKALYKPTDLSLLKGVITARYFDGLEEHRRALLEEISTESKRGNIINVLEKTNMRVRERRFNTYGNIVRRHYVEVRSPLFDYDVVDFMTTVPPSLRLGKRVYLQAFNRLSPDLAKIPWQHTDLPLSAPLARVVLKKVLEKAPWARGRDRTPIGFEHVIANHARFQSFLTDSLLNGCCVQAGLYSGDGISALLKKAFDRCTAQDTELISRLTTLELWYRTQASLLE